MAISLKEHRKDGMYLHFADGRVMDFSRERIERLGNEYWNDLSKLPQHIRDHKDFKTCTVCPFNEQDVFCSVMKPLLPFLEEMGSFSPTDEVSAVYVSHGLVQNIQDISLQKALQYITNMSLFEYCEDAKKYAPYFRGIHPFMTMNEAGSRLILNVYWGKKGDRESVVRLMEEMSRDVTIMTESCIRRLKSLCGDSAFVAAYGETQTQVATLAREIRKLLDEQFGV